MFSAFFAVSRLAEEILAGVQRGTGVSPGIDLRLAFKHCRVDESSQSIFRRGWGSCISVRSVSLFFASIFSLLLLKNATTKNL